MVVETGFLFIGFLIPYQCNYIFLFLCMPPVYKVLNKVQFFYNSFQHILAADVKKLKLIESFGEFWVYYT